MMSGVKVMTSKTTNLSKSTNQNQEALLHSWITSSVGWMTPSTRTQKKKKLKEPEAHSQLSQSLKSSNQLVQCNILTNLSMTSSKTSPNQAHTQNSQKKRKKKLWIPAKVFNNSKLPTKNLKYPRRTKLPEQFQISANMKS